jgi:phage tail sheath protein FI
MQAPQTPGVYYQRVDTSAPAISLLRTDITGFVGIAMRGPLHQALPVQSWRQFQAYFGDFTGAGYLAYAVRAFFENGGQRCWVVRVASELAATATVTLQAPSADNVWCIAASSPGVWGNNLEITVRETHRAQTLTDPKMSTPEASAVTSVTGFVRGTHVRLSQNVNNPMYKVVSDVDAIGRRLLWIHPKPEAILPYDSALDSVASGFDLTQPILVESVEYTVWVRELGRLIRVYEGLSLVPEHPRYGPRILAPVFFKREGSVPVNVPKELTPMEIQLHGAVQELLSAPEPIVIEELRWGDPADAQGWTKWKEDWANNGAQPLAALWDATTATAQPLSGGMQVLLTGGADGLAQLSAYDFIGEEVDPFDSDTTKRRKTRGLRALEEVNEVAVVAIPDIHIQPKATPRYSPPPPCIPDPCLPPGPPPPAAPREAAVGDLPPVFSEGAVFQVQAALIQHCEKLRDRIALLDPPFAAARDDKLGVSAIQAWRSRFDSQYAALYYPWLRVVDPLRSPAALTRDIPPSGHIAGQYAQSDFQFGVHKAPANTPLVWAQDVTVAVNDTVHGVLNPLGINAIRPLAGRGLRMFGARTVSSDADWRFVNVRRLMMMIEKAIDVAVQWAAFEPNHTLTRTKLQLTLTSFLLSLWERGALMGAAANEAFFVKCDEENNPPADRDQGRLTAVVGVAPSQPFEFILVRVGREQNQFEIAETSAGVFRQEGY